MSWDDWNAITDKWGHPIYFKKKLFSWTWNGLHWTLRLHKFVKADALGCFHTHPARAYRLILWGGYVEEIYQNDGYYRGGGSLVFWTPGMFGRVEPEFCHRVHALLNRKYSYSLWVVAPKTHDIKLKGWGW